MTFVKGLKCRECNQDYPKQPIHVCETCFGPLEVVYDYDRIKSSISREKIASRPKNLWRYRELLPIDGEPKVGLYSGYTPLIRAYRLGEALGVKQLYIKDDSVNHPTFSYKDRVVSVAISCAIEFGFDTVSCASTGNLANAVAAHAAKAGLNCYVFIPDGLEQAKIIGSTIYGPRTISIKGNYDDVNRLCSEIGDKYDWAFVNVNLRPYYSEGAKTHAFEIVEQLGWKMPRHIVVATAGGTILPKLAKAFNELKRVGLVEDGECKIYSAQASGCDPVIQALKKGTDLISPVKPNTIASSIAIGNPADGYYVIKTIQETGGWGESATDEEILDGIKLLASTEGIFTEPAGGTEVAVTKKLVQQGRIPRDEPTVICITGNGYKTIEAVAGIVEKPFCINADLKNFDDLYNQLNQPSREKAVAGKR
ncbi:MAG: threonine synthase [Deltaproteobacteria bacterium]|nr:threonine synthase [Deltaproteobacteria bacterium]MCZ6906445.1 threonine synthase [Deltaproteobacteria bacterium]